MVHSATRNERPQGRALFSFSDRSPSARPGTVDLGGHNTNRSPTAIAPTIRLGNLTEGVSEDGGDQERQVIDLADAGERPRMDRDTLTMKVSWC